MKKILIFISILILVLTTGLTSFAVTKKLMSVQIRSGQVRSQPSFLGKVMTKLSYGDRVEVTEEKDPWIKINTSSKNHSGWMHVSALSKKKIVFNAGDADVEKSASGDEVALAGKGFNEEVEKKFRSEHKKLKYDEIDKLEKIIVSQARIQKFLTQGDLVKEGGTK